MCSYIIELHRIPPRGTAKKVVFLQHGVMQSSGTWLVNPSSRSLGNYNHSKITSFKWVSVIILLLPVKDSTIHEKIKWNLKSLSELFPLSIVSGRKQVTRFCSFFVDNRDQETVVA
jgi:hypothetical protein